MDCTSLAIVGYSYRAPSIGRKGLWEFLAEAKSAWSKVPAERFDHDAYYHPTHEKAGCFSSQGAHFLPDDIYSFDAAFFNIRAEEARTIDPQLRMMLECALEAAESAGLTLLNLAGGNVGVFSAIGGPEYSHYAMEDLPSTSTWTATGIAPCMFANRLSYFFDLVGPSVSLDTACASSTHAVHMACQSLRSGECDAAFVNAASLLLGPGYWTILDTMGALSPEGRSYPYDTKASGFGRGEGGACLLIKRLEDAIKNGDPVHAIVRNSSCNHSGRSEGITMPRRSAQENLLLRVHEEVGLKPSQTPIVEGHGTGTQVGDPIEASAIANVLGRDRSSSDPLYIGSLKSNFGHLEGASGILGIIKAILMIQKGFVLPTAGFEELNSKIEGGNILRVARRTTPWPSHSLKRVCVTNVGRKSMNSRIAWTSSGSRITAGLGGSNAAVILEEAPNRIRRPNGNKNIERITNLVGLSNVCDSAAADVEHNNNLEHRLFVLSAKSEHSLVSYLASFLEYLDSKIESSNFFRDLSFTLRNRRTHFPYRIAVVADSVAGLKAKLVASKVNKTKDRVIVYTFTGQGAQYYQMGAGLWHYEAFSSIIEQADKCLRSMGASWSLKAELDKPESESRIDEAEISQPAYTAIQIALVSLLKSWAIAPTTVTGHSSGEIAAAYTAGLISFPAAMAIAYFRGQAANQLIQENDQNGAMLAIGASFAEASALLAQATNAYATIAAINSPLSVTISGDERAIQEIRRLVEKQGLFARELKVQVAYHSRHMERVSAAYFAAIEPYFDEETISNDPENHRAAFFSSVTGERVHVGALGPSYWVKNLVSPVRFADAIEGMFSMQSDESNQGKKTQNIIIEIGPHSALKTPIKQTAEGFNRQRGENQVRFIYLPSLLRGTNNNEALLGLAGGLFSNGISVQFLAVHQVDNQHSSVLSDLPPYAWDKSIRYIHQPRAIRNKLHPGQAYDSFLGWKIPSVGDGEHAFRQVFTIDEMPWIRDHSVMGQPVFPMTGYLSLAIEALRRIAPTPPSTILMREIHAKRSLEIGEDMRVDVTTKLRLAATGTEKFSSNVWCFEILSCSEAHGWNTHCFGRIEAEFTEMSSRSTIMRVSTPLIDSEQLIERNAHQEYIHWSQRGIFYGPTFRRMVRIWKGNGWTTQETELRKLDLSLPSSFGSPVSVDPPTLDSFLHGIGPLQDTVGKRPMQMPNYISQLRISNRIPTGDKQRFTAVCRLLSYDTRAGKLRISVAAFAQLSGKLMPIFEVENLTLRTIGLSDTEIQAYTIPSAFCWNLLPSLDFLSNSKVCEIMQLNCSSEDEILEQRQLNRTAIYFIDRALKETKEDNFSNLPSHLAKSRNWMKMVAEREEGETAQELSLPLRERFNTDSAYEMICAVGRELPAILRGEIQPLEVMLKDSLLSRYYEHDKANMRCSQVLAKIVRMISNVTPNLHILEIGAGTGSTTLSVLKELSHDMEDMLPCINYTFTDISAGFFENARSKLALWSKLVNFRTLDISRDPVLQGFTIKDYDLVIASNVLHATPNIAKTLNHVRCLLKPNGKLLLLEGVRHQPRLLPFTLLPGWWLFEDENRPYEEGPLLSEDAWHTLLSKNGFSGVDGAIADYPGTEEQTLKVLWSTRIAREAKTSNDGHILVCGSFKDDEEVKFAHMLSDYLSNHLRWSTKIMPLLEMDAADHSYCIFIDSPQSSVLQNTSSDTFSALRSVLLNTAGVLWIIPEEHSPEADSIKGMLRTLRIESAPKKLLLLEDIPFTSEGILPISKIAEQLLDPDHKGSGDQDFIWHEGMIHLPRLRSLKAAKGAFSSEAGHIVRKSQNMWQGDAALELTIEVTGSPDSIYFRRTDALTRQLNDNEVLVRVETAGMNIRDVLLIFGSVPWSPPGLEGVGTVVRTGILVSDMQPGDRVLFASAGCFATHVRMSSFQACKIPDSLNSVDAATIPIAYSTALIALVHVGRLKKGESILIHTASGETGQACLVLAQHIEARIFVTACSPSRREFVHKSFGIPLSHIFSSRTSEFKDGILSATDGRGVDVIVNTLAGDLLQESWALIADFGRFIDIGRKDVLKNSHLPMEAFDRNVTFSGVHLDLLLKDRPEEIKKLLLEIVDLLKRQVIVPIGPVTSLPISQIMTGLRKLQSGQIIGRIVLTMGPDESVLAECPAPLGHQSCQILLPSATYIVTGGTGGIGRSLSMRMIENGARNIVLLGRSGSTRPEIRELLERYEGTDVCLKAIPCDVSSRKDLIHALDAIKDLPPVQGVIHGAFYPRDSLFENATYEDWCNITSPKVQGAWNLHELMPNLDFFIMLSSMIGVVGNMGQSIYASTSTFFDSFAEYRVSRGLPAVSISLPVVLDVGYAADRDIAETLAHSLGMTLTESQLWTNVKGAMIGPSSGINSGGKAISFAFKSDALQTIVPGAYFHPRSLREPANSETRDYQTNYQAVEIDASLSLLEALMAKVALITMMERDEVEADTPLSAYGLDSLVSVELRNWIRRYSGVELPLSAIGRAVSLRNLAEHVLSQK